MPKNKTHSGTGKCSRVTDSGKFTREQTSKHRLPEVRSSRCKRKPSQDRPVTLADIRQVKKLLGR